MSNPTRCLLDKVTARRIIEGSLKLAEKRSLSDDELFALDFYYRANAQAIGLFVVPPTAQILRRLEDWPRYEAIIRPFLAGTQAALPTRYFKRWTRRLRDFGFTPEDAAVLALATFGTNEGGTILGMDSIATFDRPMIQNWAVQYPSIRERLTAMQQDLPHPFRDASLPQVQRPEYIGA
jgi:hypothetical protein